MKNIFAWFFKNKHDSALLAIDATITEARSNESAVFRQQIHLGVQDRLLSEDVENFLPYPKFLLPSRCRNRK
jgi:hypothetical protein